MCLVAAKGLNLMLVAVLSTLRPRGPQLSWSPTCALLCAVTEEHEEQLDDTTPARRQEHAYHVVS